MVQGIIIGLLFIGAVIYLFRSLRKQANGDGCGADCKCEPKTRAIK